MENKYCPVCGRKLDSRSDEIAREVLSELTGLLADSSMDRRLSKTV